MLQLNPPITMPNKRKLVVRILNRPFRTLSAASLLTLFSTCGQTTLTATPAAPIDDGATIYQNVTRLPSGDLRRVRGTSGMVKYQDSSDGVTWGPEGTWFNALGSWVGTNPITTFDSDGDAHVFQFAKPTNGEPPGGNLNLYHYGENSSTPFDSDLVYSGRVASVMNAITTAGGRLLVGFADTASTPGFTTSAWSDNQGASWAVSSSQLTVTPLSSFNGSLDGAVEPCILQKTDGSIWMLMRTQTHRLAQSASTDSGSTWSAAVDAPFHTSTGPANLLRLQDGRIVLFWNNARMPAKLTISGTDYGYYAGRDVLHAAISSDDGATWSGFREVYLDPNRNLDPVAAGIKKDSGTAYPYVAQVDGNGSIVLIAGQPPRNSSGVIPTGWIECHREFRIDPDWLEEPGTEEKFEGTDPLAGISVFRVYGSITNYRRPREQSAVIADDPVAGSSNHVLHLRRVDSAKDGDGATWNFPKAANGWLRMKLLLRTGFAGGSIGLTDRFFNPTDQQGEDLSYFRLSIGSDRVIGSTTLSADAWHDIELKWDVEKETAIVSVDGSQATLLTRQSSPGTGAQAVECLHGLSYLRLRSTASGSDTGGFMVDDLIASQDVVTQRMNPATADASLEAGSGWTSFKFDTFVPNPGNTFASPSAVMASSSLRIESSTGTVVFSDGTSYQVTSDLNGGANGGTTTLRFVDPSDGVTPATVTAAAFRFGSTTAGNVTVQLFDLDGNELKDFEFAEVPASTLGEAIGWTAVLEGSAVPMIHRIVLSGASSDAWLVGSFAQSTLLNDIGYTGLVAHP